MIFKKNELKLLSPFYIYTLLSFTFSLGGSFLVIWLNSLGYSYFEISLIFVIEEIFTFLLEIPTGAIADKYGRKKSALIGKTLRAFVYFSLAFVTNYYLLIFIFIIRALVGTLISGAYDSWIVDHLKHNNRSDLVEQYFAKFASLISLGFIFSGILAGFIISQYGLKMLWIVQGIAFLLSTFILYPVKETKYVSKLAEEESLEDKGIFNITSKAFLIIKNKKKLLWLLGGLGFLHFSAAITWYAWPVFLQQSGVKLEWIAYIESIGYAIAVFIPFMALKLKSILKEKNSLILITTLEILSLFSIFYIAGPILSLLIFLIWSSITNFEDPISEPFFHKLVPSSHRATLGSIKSMLFAITGGTSTLFVGLILDLYSAKIALLIAGALLIPVIFFYLKIKD